MKRQILAFAAIASLIAGGSNAQDSKPKSENSATPAKVGTEVDVQFLNGSLIRMMVATEKIEIATEYGKLIVPVKDIQSIEFGRRPPEGIVEKVQTAVAELTARDFKTRDKAAKALVELSPYSYLQARELLKSKDLEVSRRAKDIVKQIEKKLTEKELRRSNDDKVVTRAFPISGKILTTTLKSRTELFGEVDLALAKMGTMKSASSTVMPAELAVTLDAATYANAGQWLETAIEADGLSQITITAKGAVDTWPQQPGQYMCGPNGAARGGRVVFGGIPGGIPGGLGGNAAGQLLMQANGGALFGKIGESGDPFLVGERYQAIPKGEGKLFLTIAPSPWGCPSSGSFEAKVTTTIP